MTSLLVRFLAAVLGLFLADYLIAGITVDSFYTAAIVAVILGVLNLVVRPILMVLTLPLTILTLGLFFFVLNAALFWFVGSFVEGFSVTGFAAALLGSLVVSAVSWLTNKLT